MVKFFSIDGSLSAGQPVTLDLGTRMIGLLLSDAQCARVAQALERQYVATLDIPTYARVRADAHAERRTRTKRTWERDSGRAERRHAGTSRKRRMT